MQPEGKKHLVEASRQNSLQIIAAATICPWNIVTHKKVALCVSRMWNRWSLVHKSSYVQVFILFIWDLHIQSHSYDTPLLHTNLMPFLLGFPMHFPRSIEQSWKSLYHSMKYCWVKNGILRSWFIIIPNILGSIIPYSYGPLPLTSTNKSPRLQNV